MRAIRILSPAVVSIAVCLFPAAASAGLRVVASTEDLASIAREIGGTLVEAESIASGSTDPHFVELLPSYMVRVRKADVYVKVGMELDYWAQQIIDGSRNAKLTVVDCSTFLPTERRLEVPTRVDPSQGDVHKYGNPHYWLDPANGKEIAKAIAEGLRTADPANAPAYDRNLAAFVERLDAKIAEWRKTAERLKGLPIVTYHNSWPYFARAFGIDVVGWLEPKPGVKPSPGHVKELIDTIKARKVALVAYEPYFESRTPTLLGRETGVPVLALPPSVGGVPEVKDYIGLFDYNLTTLARVARR